MMFNSTGNRPTIGFICSWPIYQGTTIDRYSHLLIQGISAAANEHRCDLLLGCGFSATGNHPQYRSFWPVDSWNPWIPSKRNIHCITSEEDDIGIVAIPHLSRDLMAVLMVRAHAMARIRRTSRAHGLWKRLASLVQKHQDDRRY